IRLLALRDGVKSGLNLLGQSRHLMDADAAGVVNTVQYRAVAGCLERLGSSRRTERAVRDLAVQMNQRDVVRNVLDVGSAGAEHVGVLLHIMVIFLQSKADAVHDAAVGLSVDRVDVADASYEVHAGKLENRGL